MSRGPVSTSTPSQGVSALSTGNLNRKYLPVIPATPQPMLIRGSLLSGIVNQINANTIALSPPRKQGVRNQITKDDDVPIGVVAAVWDEVSKVEAEVRVENPDDSSQFVDVQRRTTSTFENAETGDTFQFNFDNT